MTADTTAVRPDLALVADIDARLAEIVEQRQDLRDRVDAEHDRAGKARRDWEQRVAAAVQSAKKLPTEPAPADVAAYGVALDQLDAEERALRQERDDRIVTHADELEDACAAIWGHLVADLAPHVAALETATAQARDLLNAVHHIRYVNDRGTPGPTAYRPSQRTLPVNAIDLGEVARLASVGASPLDLQPPDVPFPRFDGREDGDDPIPPEPAPVEPLAGGARL